MKKQQLDTPESSYGEHNFGDGTGPRRNALMVPTQTVSTGPSEDYLRRRAMADRMVDSNSVIERGWN